MCDFLTVRLCPHVRHDVNENPAPGQQPAPDLTADAPKPTVAALRRYCYAEAMTMSEERLAVALVGAGGFGARTLEALQQSDRIRIVGVADKDAAVAEQVYATDLKSVEQ